MKRYLILLCFLLAVGCTAQNLTPPEDVSKLLSDGALLIDVRTKSEFDSGHLEGALHQPYQDILKLPKLEEVDKDKPIVVYCRSGRRSGFAYDTLKEAGFKNVYNGGGYESLKKSGL